LAKETALAH